MQLKDSPVYCFFICVVISFSGIVLVFFFLSFKFSESLLVSDLVEIFEFCSYLQRSPFVLQTIC